MKGYQEPGTAQSDLATIDGDALVAEEALKVGDVHPEREQPGGDRMAQQVRVNSVGDSGRAGDATDDLANALAGQHVRRRAGALLAASE